LPAVQTTRHTPIPSLPENAINQKGRIKFRDKLSGRIKYLDAKLGLGVDEFGNYSHNKG